MMPPRRTRMNPAQPEAYDARVRDFSFFSDLLADKMDALNSKYTLSQAMKDTSTMEAIGTEWQRLNQLYMSLLQDGRTGEAKISFMTKSGSSTPNSELLTAIQNAMDRADIVMGTVTRQRSNVIESLNRKIQELGLNIQGLLVKAKDAETLQTEIASKNRIIAEINSKLLDLTNQRDACIQQKTTELAKLKTAADAKIESIRAAMELLNKQLQAALEAKASADADSRKQMDALKATIASLETKLANAASSESAQVKELKTQITSYESALKEIKEQFAKTANANNAQVATLTQQLSAYESAIKSLERKLELANATGASNTSDLKAQVEKYAATIKQLEQALEASRLQNGSIPKEALAKIAEYENAIRKLRAELSVANASKSEGAVGLQNQIATLKAQLARQGEAHLAAVNELNKTIEGLNAALTLANTEKSQLENENNTRKLQIQTLSNDLDIAQSALSASLADNNISADTIAELNAQIASLDAKIETFENDPVLQISELKKQTPLSLIDPERAKLLSTIKERDVTIKDITARAKELQANAANAAQLAAQNKSVEENLQKAQQDAKAASEQAALMRNIAIGVTVTAVAAGVFIYSRSRK